MRESRRPNVFTLSKDFPRNRPSGSPSWSTRAATTGAFHTAAEAVVLYARKETQVRKRRRRSVESSRWKGLSVRRPRFDFHLLTVDLVLNDGRRLTLYDRWRCAQCVIDI